MKIIEFTRCSIPTDKTVYGDTVKVYDGMNVIYNGYSSTCPNPFRPSNMVPWEKAYAMVSTGTYKGCCIENHARFGKCILLENGGELPTINANAKHGGRHVALEVFIHTGNKPDWRGSMACLTIPPCNSKKFFEQFRDGEQVVVAIISPERKV